MKETTGELNLTLIVVMAVGVLVAFFYFVIWPFLNTNFMSNSMCSKAVCDNPCGQGSGTNVCNEAIGHLVECKVKNGTDDVTIMCPWKG